MRDMEKWTSNLSLLLQILLIGLLDYLSGHEFNVSFLYFIPVGMSAWYRSGALCFFLATLSALTWQWANDLAGEPYHALVVNLWNDLAQIIVFLTVAFLLKRLKRQLLEAQRLAQQDFLTGLPNRRLLLDRLGAELSRASRGKEPLVVGYIDLDHFKQLNDDYGHSEGDRLLFTFSRTLSEKLRRSDILARMGGDEFVLVLPNCDLESARRVGGKISATLDKLCRDNGWPVTASVGMLALEHPRAFESVDEILAAADKLMYQMKKDGRNGFLLQKWCG